MTCRLVMARSTCPMLPASVGKVVSGWGIDGVTTFQKGFPLPISLWCVHAALAARASHKTFNLRPNVVPGCDKSTAHITVRRAESLGSTRTASLLLRTGVSATSRASIPRFEAQGSITGTSRFSRRRTSVRITSSASVPDRVLQHVQSRPVWPAQHGPAATTSLWEPPITPASELKWANLTIPAYPIRSEVPVLNDRHGRRLDDARGIDLSCSKLPRDRPSESLVHRFPGTSHLFVLASSPGSGASNATTVELLDRPIAAPDASPPHFC